MSSSTWYYLWVNDSTTSAGKVKNWYTAAQVGCGSGTGTCSVTPTIALAQGDCQWWVQTWNEYGYGPWSSGMPFNVSSPVGYWRLNGDLSDSSGRGNGGTFHFMSSAYNAFSAGRLNSALNCSGGAYAEIPNSSSLSALGSVTIEAWIYPNQYPTAIEGSSVGGPIVNKWGPSGDEDDEYILSINPDGRVHAAFSGISYGHVNITSSRLIPPPSSLSGWRWTGFAGRLLPPASPARSRPDHAPVSPQAPEDAAGNGKDQPAAGRHPSFLASSRLFRISGRQRFS